MNEEQKRREMQVERMQEDLLNCLVFSRNGGVKCRETAENLSIMGYCKPDFPIELLDVDALDKAWLKGFDKGFDEGVIVSKEFAKRLKEKASYLETENRGLGESSVDRELDEILKVYRYDETKSNRSL